jgi:hypothetical protein
MWEFKEYFMSIFGRKKRLKMQITKQISRGGYWARMLYS